MGGRWVGSGLRNQEWEYLRDPLIEAKPFTVYGRDRCRKDKRDLSGNIVELVKQRRFDTLDGQLVIAKLRFKCANPVSRIQRGKIATCGYRMFISGY